MIVRDIGYRPRSLRPLRPELYRKASSVPDDWSLTDDVLTAAEGWLEDAIREGRLGKDQVAEVISRIEIAPIAEAAASNIERDLIQNLPSLVRSLRGGERRIAHYLDSIWGPADRMYEAVLFAGYEIGRAIAKHPGQGPVIRALSGLHARACTVAAEVRLCAMNGFASAAEARWRSLHELDVVSNLISRNSRDLAERYLASSVVERWDDANQFQKVAARLNREPYEDDVMTEWKANRDAALRRFGPRMGRANGWAEPLFPGLKPKDQISFRRLEEAASLDHFRPFYRHGSHSVHAGARSADLGMVDDGTGLVRTTGATVYANISENCHGSLISFLHVTLALAMPEGEHEAAERRFLDNLIGGQILIKWVDIAGDRYAACADRAKERDLF